MNTNQDIYHLEQRLNVISNDRRLSGTGIEVGRMVRHGRRMSQVCTEHINGIHIYFASRGYNVDEILKWGVGTAIRIRKARCTVVI